MVDHKDSLIREVDEELRREQLLKLWEKYGTYLVAAALLIVAAVGGYKYYEYRRAVAAAAAGAEFAFAARDAANDKPTEAQREWEEIAKSGPSSYATLARLRLAATARAEGRIEAAAEAYEELGRQSGVDPLLSGYARLQAATLRLNTLGWTEMQSRLNDLAADSSPWRYSARELLGLAAQKAGRIEDARAEFVRLMSDRNVPAGIAERARVMMALLTEAQLAQQHGADAPAHGNGETGEAKSAAPDPAK